ncbi:1438_t:CDS:1, partial [Funneliformis caledonium]
SSLDPLFGFSANSTSQTLSHSKCLECGKQTKSVAWCKNCDLARLREHFRCWTNGDPTVDEFIRHTKLNAEENLDYLEWIDFDQFVFVENINKRGAFSTIYSALWMEGPKWKLDEEAEIWNRNGPIKVILKRLDNSQNMSQEFVKQ